MLELTPDNAVDYLRGQGWIGSGPARVEALGWGVSNVVLRVASGGQLLVVKQSRPQLRTRDAWFSDLERVYREQEVMQLLEPLLPEGTVPTVLHSDRANYVFAMSHAPLEARVWKETLLAGEVDQAVGARAGTVLGMMHETTARRAASLESLRDVNVFFQLRVNPFYVRIRERHGEVGEAVTRIIEEMRATHEALCHGDYSPKNILTHSRGFTLVDYETAHLGDPAMDLGFFLSHLILKAVKNHPLRNRYFELSRTFWHSYSQEIFFRPAEELEARAAGHFAVCALARIDGTSPVDYLPEEVKRAAVRRLGRAVLLDRPGRWSDVLALCERELANLGWTAA
jgi:5-methylthioribose kinase